MKDASALRLALELVHSPWQSRRVRSAPLPDDVETLLHIAAGDEQTLAHTIEATGRSRDVIVDAAAFYIEQVLLCSDENSYRVLGVGPEATIGELRRNMALLLRWLHPDLDRQGERSIFASRVTNAWNNLKTPERRQAYDRLRKDASTTKTPGREGAYKAQVRQKKQALHRSKPRTGQSSSSRSPYASPETGGSLLQRVRLFLFGRAAH